MLTCYCSKWNGLILVGPSWIETIGQIHICLVKQVQRVGKQLATDYRFVLQNDMGEGVSSSQIKAVGSGALEGCATCDSVGRFLQGLSCGSDWPMLEFQDTGHTSRPVCVECVQAMQCLLCIRRRLPSRTPAFFHTEFCTTDAER